MSFRNETYLYNYIGCTSEKQILFEKFGFSLGLHYLCSYERRL